MDRAMLDRDVSYDGIFFTAVRTTGVFCRPSCPARKPNLQNVEYYPSVREALLNGYRPCKRCRPLELDGRTPEWVEPLLARINLAPRKRLTDSELKSLGIDPARVRRYFREHYGMTFQAYHRALRMGLALRDLQGGNGDVRVAVEHGYESLSGFRDAFHQTFRKPAGRSRGVCCVMTRTVRTPIGAMWAGANEEGVCLLEFTDRPALPRQIETLRKRLNAALVPGHNEHLELLVDELDQYFRKALTAATVAACGGRSICSTWNNSDISHVSEHDFPVVCGECGSPLTGLGDHGACPRCGTGFDRRRRLWETFGPEAFADPPITEPEEGSTLTGAVVLGLLVAVAFIPFLMWLSRVVFECVELLFVLFAWLLILVAMLWLLTVRLKERSTRSDSQRNGADETTSPKCP